MCPSLDKISLIDITKFLLILIAIHESKQNGNHVKL